MSLKVMSAVWESDLPPMDRFVLLAIADFCDDAGKCWPSVRRIAEKVGMGERGVRKIIRRLEECGWLETDIGGGRHGCSEYRIKPGTTFPPEQRSPRNDSAETRNESAQNPEPRSPEPSRTVKEPSGSPLTPHEILSSLLRSETAADFIAQRKAMKKPVTAEAAKRIVAKLQGHPDPDAVVDESIANGWQGVFPEKVKSHVKRINSGQAIDAAQRAAQRWESRRMGGG